MGSAYARVALGCAVAARRAAVGRRGREQGQRADARSAPAAEVRADHFRRQRRRARRLLRRRRRHRLRRVHRQRHAEDQRRAGRDRRAAAARRAVVDLRHARRLPAVAPGVPPLPQARRLLRVRRRAARRPQRPLHRRPRPLVGESRAQRRDDGRAVPSTDGAARAICARESRRQLRATSVDPIDPNRMIAFVFPGQGAQKVGMGKALAEAFPICRETFAEADAALGEPLSTLCFEGPDERLMLTENTQPAILAMSIAACAARRVARRARGVRGGAQPRRVFGARRGRYAILRGCAAHGAAARAVHAGSGAGRRGRDGGDPRARRRGGRRGACAEARAELPDGSSRRRTSTRRARS